MSTKTEITRLQNAKSSIKTAIEGKGVTVPDNTKLDGMAELINSISSGITAVQTEKTLTITTNGTTTIMPDAPYDALKKVNVTVNVANGGGSGETTMVWSYLFLVFGKQVMAGVELQILTLHRISHFPTLLLAVMLS